MILSIDEKDVRGKGVGEMRNFIVGPEGSTVHLGFMREGEQFSVALLRGSPAEAKMDKSGKAPTILIMDHRGCKRGGANKEYTGAKAGGQDDEMCVKVSSDKVAASEAKAAAMLAEALSFKAKGIDGPYTGLGQF